jgi:hypothetical protein
MYVFIAYVVVYLTNDTISIPTSSAKNLKSFFLFFQVDKVKINKIYIYYIDSYLIARYKRLFKMLYKDE